MTTRRLYRTAVACLLAFLLTSQWTASASARGNRVAPTSLARAQGKAFNQLLTQRLRVIGQSRPAVRNRLLAELTNELSKIPAVHLEQKLSGKPQMVRLSQKMMRRYQAHSDKRTFPAAIAQGRHRASMAVGGQGSGSVKVERSGLGHSVSRVIQSNGKRAEHLSSNISVGLTDRTVQLNYNKSQPGTYNLSLQYHPGTSTARLEQGLERTVFTIKDGKVTERMDQFADRIVVKNAQGNKILTHARK